MREKSGYESGLEEGRFHFACDPRLSCWLMVPSRASASNTPLLGNFLPGRDR
jgi:hypothetical protein